MFYQVDSDTGQWLSVFDSWLCSKIMQERRFEEGLEIGVWKGGWAISQLLNNKVLRIVGVDPFPDLEEISSFLSLNLTSYGVSERFQLFPSAEFLLAFTNKFSFVHIDGEHSEEAVTFDLNFASQILTSDGVIAVDDIYHPEFPGIASATFKFLHHNDFASFLITENKMFICRKEKYPEFYKFCMDLLSSHSISFSQGFKGVHGAKYQQSNSINGFSQLIVRPDVSSLNSFYKLIDLHRIEKDRKNTAVSTKRKLLNFLTR